MGASKQQVDMNSSGITPVDHRIVVKPDPVEEITAGGIFLADTTKEKRKFAATRATLIAVGANAFDEWGADNGPKPGARVCFAQYSGAEQEGKDGERYVIMNDEDLLAVIEEAK
jgi:chaperonin GroES